MTPATRLKAALKGMDVDALSDVARRADIEFRLAHRAALGIPINAEAYLKLCAALRLDPVDGSTREQPQRIGGIHWPSLSAALRIARFASKRSLRQSAKASRISYSALGRIERGEIVSIDNVLAACAFIGRHPFDFVSPVTRETTETRSAA